MFLGIVVESVVLLERLQVGAAARPGLRDRPRDEGDAQPVTDGTRGTQQGAPVAPSLVEPGGTAEPTQIHSEADEGAKGLMMVDSPPHQPHKKKKILPRRKKVFLRRLFVTRKKAFKLLSRYRKRS